MISSLLKCQPFSRREGESIYSPRSGLFAFPICPSTCIANLSIQTAEYWEISFFKVVDNRVGRRLSKFGGIWTYGAKVMAGLLNNVNLSISIQYFLKSKMWKGFWMGRWLQRHIISSTKSAAYISSFRRQNLRLIGFLHQEICHEYRTDFIFRPEWWAGIKLIFGAPFSWI